MKAKTVLEFGDRRVFATALMDTGNKLYDPIFHKPVILVDEKMVGEMLSICKKEYPEKLHFIPFHSVGRENGILEGLSFDCVSIKWQNKQLKFENVIEQRLYDCDLTAEDLIEENEANLAACIVNHCEYILIDEAYNLGEML